jgi:hypothetical protein
LPGGTRRDGPNQAVKPTLPGVIPPFLVPQYVD